MEKIKMMVIAFMSIICLATSCGGDDGGDDPVKPTPKNISLEITLEDDKCTKTVSLDGLDSEVVSVSGNSIDWLTARRDDYYSGTPTITIEVETNNNSFNRSTILFVTCKNGDKATVNITQIAMVPKNLLTPNKEVSHQQEYAKHE